MKATERFKKRYVLFRVIGEQGATESEVRNCVHEAVLSFFGEDGVSCAAFKLVHYGHAKKIGIARVQREQAGKMVACISLVNSIAGKGARLECVRSSGTVAALLRKA
ncbi:hypothetical protein J4441_04310 [Candidatus Micrarchaeota archaeon]|nr:hypothetical protein [Candidatus Micrarchaeota archaeon]